MLFRLFGFGSKLDQVSDNECGASLVEYALAVGLIAAVAVGSVTTLGDEVTEPFTMMVPNGVDLGGTQEGESGF